MVKSIIFLVGCWVALGMGTSITAQDNPPKPLDPKEFYGSMKDGKYTNPYFGFSFTAPASYPFVEAAESKLLSKAGADFLRNGDRQYEKTLDDAEAKTRTLFGLYREPRGTPGNSVLESATVRQPQGITANIALSLSVGVYTKNPNFKVEKTLDDVKFGNKSFAGAVISGNINNVPLRIEMYAIMIRGYSLIFAITYTTEEGRVKMLDVMKSLEFSKV